MTDEYRCKRGCTDRKQCRQISGIFMNTDGTKMVCNRDVCEHESKKCTYCDDIYCNYCCHFVRCNICPVDDRLRPPSLCINKTYEWNNINLCGNGHICGEIVKMTKDAELLKQENEQLQKENQQQKEEIIELKYRPGGIGYDEAEADFNALSARR